jgi:hypothetical protein
MRLHLHLHGGYRTYDAFEESKVKRGQPKNAGQFAAQHAAYHETLTKAGFNERTPSRFIPKGEYWHPSGAMAKLAKGHFNLRTATGKTLKSSNIHSETERRADLESKVGQAVQEPERQRQSNTSPIKHPDLSREQKTAVEDYYQLDTAAPINGGKINRYLMGTGPATPEIKQAVSRLDQFLDQCVVQTPLQVFRGIGNMDTDHYRPGSVVSDARFTSTSHDEEIADQFAKFKSGNLEGSRNRNPGKFVIDLPKGAKAADMGNLGLGIGHTGHGDEAEVLLPRDQKFRVKLVEGRTVHLEAIVGD